MRASERGHVCVCGVAGRKTVRAGEACEEERGRGLHVPDFRDRNGNTKRTHRNGGMH